MMASGNAPGSAARGLALRLLLEWDRRKNVYIETIVREALGEDAGAALDLEARDRRFVAELCYGVIRHRNTLRRWAEQLCHQPLRVYHRTVRVALSLGLYQRLYLRTPSHAVVDSTVSSWRELMRAEWGPKRLRQGVSLLNAVLRNACGAVRFDPPDRGDSPEASDRVWTPSGWVQVEGLGLGSLPAPERLAFAYSHPLELVQLWAKRYEPDVLRGILEHGNRVPPTTLVFRRDVRLNVAERKLRLLGLDVQHTDDDQVLRVSAPGPIPSLPGYDAGEFWIQDVTARRLAMLLPKREHATLLDLCAAPGGKLATLLDRNDFASVLAVDRSPEKLRRLAQNLERLRFDIRRVSVLEAPPEPDHLRIDRSFDQIILDVPCSNTGVLARRHEARWRFRPDRVRELNRTQTGLLRQATHLLNAGGDLLYTTCSLEPGENSEVVHAILRQSVELRLVHEVEILPGENGDGGYGALLRRR